MSCASCLCFVATLLPPAFTVCVSVYACTCVCVCVHVCVHVFVLYVCGCACMCMHIFMCVKHLQVHDWNINIWIDIRKIIHDIALNPLAQVKISLTSRGVACFQLCLFSGHPLFPFLKSGAEVLVLAVTNLCVRACVALSDTKLRSKGQQLRNYVIH